MDQKDNVHGTMMPELPGSFHFGVSSPALAMAYVLMQPEVKRVYKPEDALRQGTLFPELDKPFLRYKGGR